MANKISVLDGELQATNLGTKVFSATKLTTSLFRVPFCFLTTVCQQINTLLCDLHLPIQYQLYLITTSPIKYKYMHLTTQQHTIASGFQLTSYQVLFITDYCVLQLGLFCFHQSKFRSSVLSLFCTKAIERYVPFNSPSPFSFYSFVRNGFKENQQF